MKQSAFVKMPPQVVTRAICLSRPKRFRSRRQVPLRLRAVLKKEPQPPERLLQTGIACKMLRHLIAQDFVFNDSLPIVRNPIIHTSQLLPQLTGSARYRTCFRFPGTEQIRKGTSWAPLRM